MLGEVSAMERLYRLIYPMRACLITSRHGKKDNIMAASWVFPLSMEPPLFGVSLSGKGYSCGLIRKGRAFGINMPHPELQKATLACGRQSGRDIDKFKEAGLAREEATHVPLVKECPVSIECEVVEEMTAGDHVVFVGKAIKTVKRFEAKGLYHLGGNEFVSV